MRSPVVLLPIFQFLAAILVIILLTKVPLSRPRPTRRHNLAYDPRFHKNREAFELLEKYVGSTRAVNDDNSNPNRYKQAKDFAPVHDVASIHEANRRTIRRRLSGITPAPTPGPSSAPTSSPTKAPTPSPTPSPTKAPTPSPTASPTPGPTASPTPAPTPWWDGYHDYVSVFNVKNTPGTVGEITFALDYLAAADSAYFATSTSSTDAHNLTMCYRFENEHFQHYPHEKMDIRFISKVDSWTGSPNWAVVDVPEVLQFRGFGINDGDTIFFVEKHLECNFNETSSRAHLRDYSSGTKNLTDSKRNVVSVNATGHATFAFATANSGKDFNLCYKFQTEIPYRVDNYTISVTQLHQVRQSHGDLGVSIVDYPKSYQLLGNYLAHGDLFRWGINSDCNNPAELYEEGDNTLHLNTSHPNNTSPMTLYSTVMNTTITMRASASGKNLTLCYKHRDEPWTPYHFFTNDVRMVHNVSTIVGDFNNSVSDQPKHLRFKGHGLHRGRLSDKAKFVHANALTYDMCNLPDQNAVLTDADDTADQHKVVVPLSSGDVGSTFTFSPTTAGHVVHLCYKFDNEPYQVYPLMKMRVHHVTSMSSFQGDKSYIVAHVKERLAINGSFVTASDYGRWVKGTASTDADCEDTSFVLKSDDIASGIIQTNSEEPIVVNQTLAEVTPNQERDGKQITFRFNSSYMGESPKYCHKFKNEPYKLYPHMTTKIAHVNAITVDVGDVDVAVVDYPKTFTFHGGHITNVDNVKWTTGHCDTEISSHNNTDIQIVNVNSSVTFNFTSANSGDVINLCYKFGNEPYRLYNSVGGGQDFKVDLRMIHNITTLSGDWNRSVVDYPKPLDFHGHGLKKGDRAKFLWSPFHVSDCNDMSKTAMLLFSSANEMKIGLDASGLKNGSATFQFAPQAGGYWVALCYAFENEPYQLYYQLRSQVNMVRDLTALNGDIDVAVVDYPKTIYFSGDFLSAGDQFRWVDPSSSDNCDLTSDIYGDTPNLPHLSHLPQASAHVLNLNTTQVLQYPSPIVPYTTTTYNTFTMTPKSAGRNNTLCYKHRNEPWKIYESFHHDVRMIQGFLTTSGDVNVSVVDQDKPLTFTGPGQNYAHDRVKFVKRFDLKHPSNVNYFLGNQGYVDGTVSGRTVAFDDCNNMTRTAYANGVDYVDQSYLRGGQATTINFSNSSGGYVVMLCYKFENEPYQLYTQFVSQVHMVRNITSYQGGSDMIVSHVKERMAFHGDYITSQDKVRWVVGNGAQGTDADCEKQILDTHIAISRGFKKVRNDYLNITFDVEQFNYTYNDHESIVTNVTNPNSVYPVTNRPAWGGHQNTSHEATFLFNESYSGFTPALCYKFKNEPWKIYNSITTRIGHISSISVSEGATQVSVVDYSKTWQFHGGNIEANDRFKWVLTSTSGCGYDSDGEYTHLLNATTKRRYNLVESSGPKRTGYFNFTSASKGRILKLCYGFSNEPYRPYLEFPLDIKMVVSSTASVGSEMQAVPFYEKYFFFAGQGLMLYDQVKWVSWYSDCNNDVGVTLKDGNVKSVLKTYTTGDGQTLLPTNVDGTYSNAMFMDPSSAGLNKLCYKFMNEPFMEYYTLPVWINGISSLVASEGDNDKLVIGYAKEFLFDGSGVQSGDVATLVEEGATSDVQCGSDSPLITTVTATIDSDGKGVFQTFDKSYAGRSFLLCFKFGLEPTKLFPHVRVDLLTFGTLKASAGSNSSAVVGATKTLQLFGGQVAEGDRVKWVEGIDTDAGCQSAISGGMLNASVVDGDLDVSFDFTSPSPAGSGFLLCYGFRNEPFKLYTEFALKVNGLKAVGGLNDTHAMIHTSQPLGFLGDGITDLDTFKFVSFGSDCNDASAFGAGSSLGKVELAASSVTFTSAEEQLVLCYKFSTEPFKRYDNYQFTALSPEVQKSSVSSIVVGHEKLVKFRGTFGVSTEDAIKFVPNSADNCMGEGADGEGPDNDARATSVYIPANLTRSTDLTHMGQGISFFKLSATEGVDSNTPLLLCYRFGPPGKNYSFFPIISLTIREISYLSVDMTLLSTLNSEVEFTFSGFGIEDTDVAFFVDPAANTDADCGTYTPAGGSSEATVVAGKAIYKFSSGFDSLVLCYKFNDEGWKIYKGLEVVDISVSEEEIEEVFMEAPAEVTLSLEGTIDDIPEGSPARATFEANFVSDISGALGIDPSRITILSVVSGSIIVNFKIAVSQNSAEPLVTELVAELVEQVNDPTSAVNSGTVTSAVQEAPTVEYQEIVAPVVGTVTSAAIIVVPYQQSGIFNFASSEYYTTEGSGTAKLKILRTHGSFGDVFLRYTTVEGSAKAGFDYVHTSNVVIVKNGETEAEIEVPLIDDNVLERHYETFDVFLRIDDVLTNPYFGSVGYDAVVGSKRNATVRVYDWGEGGTKIAATSFVPSEYGQGDSTDMKSWAVLGNEAEDLFLDEAQSVWVDSHGLSGNDIRYSSSEYNDKCDYAAPLKPCGYSCQYGDHALANPSTGEPSTVLQLDGNGYVASLQPFQDSATDVLTIAMWARGSSMASAPKGTLFSYMVNSTENEDEKGFHEILLSNHKDLSLLIKDRVVDADDRYDGSTGGDRRGIKLGVSLADDNWHFVVVTWRSTDGRVMCFLDGAKVFEGGPYKAGELIRTGGSTMVGMAQEGPCQYTPEGILSSCELKENTGFIGQVQNVLVSKTYATQETGASMMRIPVEVSMDSVPLFWKFSVLTSSGRVISDSSGQGFSPYTGGNRGYASTSGSSLVVGTPKSLAPLYPCGEIYANIWHFHAGEAGYSGNLLKAYGGRLQFKLKASSYYGNIRNGRGSVVMIALDGTAISYQRIFGAPHDNGGLGTWNYYSVVLREDHGWYSEPEGKLITRSEFETVLQQVDKILIRGDEYVYGGEGSGMEVVVINDVSLYEKA